MSHGQPTAEFGVHVRMAGTPDGSGVYEIDVAGELDLLTVGRFEEAVQLVLDHQPDEIAVDLSQVRFIDSSGLRALVTGQRECRRMGGRMRLLRPSARTQRLLEITGLVALFA